MPVDFTDFRPLSRNIAAFFGLDVRLPDGTSIRAVHYPELESELDEYHATTYAVYPLVIPPGALGSLAEGQIVRLPDGYYYVAAVADLKLGWSSATLQAATEQQLLLVVDGAYLGVDGDELAVTV